MQLGQHLILLLAGRQKPRERMINHFRQDFRDVSKPRDPACVETPSSIKRPSTLGACRAASGTGSFSHRDKLPRKAHVQNCMCSLVKCLEDY